MKPTKNPCEISADLVRELHCDAFRAQVGTGKPLSRSDAGERTAIELATLDGYGQAKSSPDLCRFLRLAAVLPLDYANSVLALAGLGHVQHVEPHKVQLLQLNSDAAQLVARVATAFRNGHVDHRAELQLLPLIRELQELCTDYLAQHGGGEA